ncbi:NAD(P)/FAD-dependent oxidoreductase [Streptomyces pinistramenti]|uniref:NAD(P)/FAD-dependent oxidoreductase n=1 Tax=Streptomyces pinistramenti TaxID=2884812 RepID=UPI001D08492D|nr:NAD(P)/FAD-dependent oxidoreductase [Streptomyces pinistramenti]MCB5909106.1 NAD(P)/FAD-dependent oxidoreductase [Streptomyces pinistramenti]
MKEQTVRHVNGSSVDGDQRYDVVVIGGGAAGLSGALTLGRARRSVVVIDSGQPRNEAATGVHAYLGREGDAPGALLADGRDEVRAYGGQVRQGTVVSVARDATGFAVRLVDGEAVHGKRLLVATGLVDELPEVPGLAELWGACVLHCPYCHGWEARDQAIGVLGTGPLAVHQALLWRQWSERITLFLHTGPEPSDEEYEQLAARGIAVVDGEVSALEKVDGRLTGVRLAGGTVIPCQALCVAPRFTARAGFLAALGLEPAELERGGTVIGSHIPGDATGRTAVPGVWVAGNATDPIEQVIGSAAAGARAAGAINADLIDEETRVAVAVRRAGGVFSPEMEREVCERVLGDRRHGL